MGSRCWLVRSCRRRCVSTNLSTSIEELSNKVLTVYPNPINEYANIEFIADNSSATRIEILNSIGQIVFNKNLGIVEGEQVVNLDASNLSSGYYFIQVALVKTFIILELL